MLLKSFTVHDFQSVRDSTPVDVGDITCLVGKNEAGKTALLRALYRLNPIEPADNRFDVTDDYPRSHVTEYQQRLRSGKAKDAIVTRATFQLEPSELGPIEAEYGEGIIRDGTLTLTRGYANHTDFHLELHADVAARHHATTTGGAKSDSSDLAGRIYRKYLEAHVPVFLYFDDYYQMRGCENIEALRKRMSTGHLIPSDHPLIGLIELAGLDLEDLTHPDRTQDLKNRLQGAGNHLTRQILKYWSQNTHLRLAFDVRPARPGDPEGMRTGTNIWAEVVDQKHFVNTPLGNRSRGFVWFFSFLAWYTRLRAVVEGRRVILLLDEPGLSLHARAQQDLLRFFEQELHAQHQLLYSTHSPFMVDPHHLERVRIVQDRSVDTDDLPAEESGTKVVANVLDADAESLFPLQSALGYTVARNLTSSSHSLLVDSAADLLYIQTISAMLGASGRTELSPRWAVTPVGGSATVSAFVALTHDRPAGRVAAWVDLEAGTGAIENLHQRGLLERNHVLTFAQFTGKSEADIEDMFEAEFYVDLVNKEYAKQLPTPIRVADLDLQRPRILASLQDYLASHPMKNGEFTRHRPARYLSEKTAGPVATLPLKVSPVTLDRFEEAFKAINGLL